MDTRFTNITVYDHTIKRSRALSVPLNLRLSQLRQLIEKQWEVKDFRFFNEGTICIKGTQKHVPLQMYLDAFNTITIATQRQQPKKQSKIIQKQSKKQQVLPKHSIPLHNSPPEASSLTTQQIIKQKHFKWTQQNIQYCSFKYSIQLSEDGYGLDHDFTKINMEVFVKYQWANIEWLGLYDCQIDDQAWRLFVEKAYLFPKLKILGLKFNKITNLKQGDLECFKSLKLVEFGTQSGENPLTEQKIQAIKQAYQSEVQAMIKFPSALSFGFKQVIIGPGFKSVFSGKKQQLTKFSVSRLFNVKDNIKSKKKKEVILDLNKVKFKNIFKLLF